MDKQEKMEQFREEMLKHEKELQQRIEVGVKDFLTDNPMDSVVMVSRKKYLMVGAPIHNIINLARMMIQQPIFKQVVKKALAVSDGDYKIIRQHYHNPGKVIKSLYEQ